MTTRTFLLFMMPLHLLTVSTARAKQYSEDLATACGINRLQFQQMVSVQHSSYPVERWIKTCLDLRRIGFKTPALALQDEPDLMMSGDLLGTHNYLKKLGFRDFDKFILKNAFLLGMNPGTIRLKIDGLGRLGFLDPVKMIRLYPNLLKLDLEANIQPKLAALESLGFKKTIKMIERHPAILGLSVVHNVTDKIEELRELGFVEPQQLIETFPPLLSYNVEENIVPKIVTLKRLGFKDPLSVVAKYPAILGLDMKNNVIPTLNHLINDWGFDITRIARYPLMLGGSLARYRDLYKFLVERGVEVRGLEEVIKMKAIKKLKVTQIELDLRRRGFVTLEQQISALARPSLRSSIFDQASCGEAFEKAS